MLNRILALACGVIGALSAVLALIFFLVPKMSLNTIELACGGDCADADTIQVALQLGRLDIISLLLAFLGLLIAVLGVFGFLAIRERAVLQAREAAQEVAKETAKGAAKEAALEWLNGSGRQLIARQVGEEFGKLDTAFDEGIRDDDAGLIAAAFPVDDGNRGGQ